MKSSKKLVLELKKLNHKLDQINNGGRFMVYDANPFKFAWFNFMAGVFHSIGTLIGTIIITGIIVYVLSKINFSQTFNDWINKFIPKTKSEQIIFEPSNYLSPTLKN
jgi:hypothetical protein